MKTDDEKRLEDLKLVEKNVELLAQLAQGNFIDPTFRPKSERVKFTAEQYTEDVMENIAYWKTADVNTYMRSVYGVGEMALNAVQDQFALYLQVWRLLNYRPDEAIIAEDAEKKARRRHLRTTQADMDVFDANRKCLACGMFLFQYDATNNQRHKKDEVCTCNSSRVIQSQMRAKTSAYRKGIEHKKKIPKKDPKRYDK